MSADFQRVKQIFLAALEQSPGASRAGFLDQACGGDAELRKAVDALLTHEARTSGFLESPAAGLAATLDEAKTEPLGAVIGPYKLLQEIGEGGMGTVYLAEQTHPVQRQVALKIVKPGMDSRQVLARFEVERQALALMDHPNIAKVLDADTTEAGRPYFVMELVKGVPITQYCDEHHLGPRQRLELFLPVCHAVQHAHQKGVIHRDLKPSNVLVAEYDDQPVPKVIDFGVAKATGPKLTERTMFTELGQVVGTLEYMSPEQAKLNALDVDTRSDVYALGVLLYELLTGTTPFEKKRLGGAALDEVLRIIREEEPPKPSTRLSTADGLPSIAANRGLEPKRLTGLVRGDLDWIVMKCLEKDRNRRYQTANNLSSDLQHYLADEPVEAGPPSALYRFRKFARRNKIRLTIATVAFAALVAGVVLIWREKHWAELAYHMEAEARSAEAEQRRQAEDNFSLARQAVDRYLTRVSESPELKARGLESLRRQLLESASEFYKDFVSRRSQEPRSRADLGSAYARLAHITDELGRRVEAEQLWRKSVGLFEELAGGESALPEYASGLIAARTGLVKHLLLQIGSLKETEAECGKAIEVGERLVREHPAEPSYQMDLAEGHQDFALVYQYQRLFNKAEAEYREAQAILQRLVRDYPSAPSYEYALARGEGNIGYLYTEMGRTSDAEAAHRHSLQVMERLSRANPADPKYQIALAKKHLNFGYTYQRSAERRATRSDRDTELAKSETEFQQAVQQYERLAREHPYVPDYQGSVDFCRGKLGWIYKETGRHDWAETELRKVVTSQEALRQVYPDYENLYMLGWARFNLAELYWQTERRPLAEPELRQALAVFEQLAAKGPNDPECLSALAEGQQLAITIYLGGRRPKDAESACRRLVDVLRRKLQVNGADASDYNLLARRLANDVGTAWHNPAEAVALAKRGLELNPSDRDLPNALGVASYRAGDWQAAIAALQKSMEIRSGGDVYDWLFLAMAHWQLGRKDEARNWNAKASEWAEKNKSQDAELSRFRQEAADLLQIKK